MTGARSRRSGRPRSEASRQAILAATVKLLRERGYGKLSIEAIATQAGVGKQTIYRWWASKGALVAEAYGESARVVHPDPDTGELRADLDTFMHHLVARARQPDVAMASRSMMAAAQLDPAWADEYVAFITDRRRVLHTILSRGVTRGELRTDADLEVAVDMLFGPWWYRLLARHAPLDDDFAATLVTQLLAGIGADLAAQNFTEQ